MSRSVGFPDASLYRFAIRSFAPLGRSDIRLIPPPPACVDAADAAASVPGAADASAVVPGAADAGADVPPASGAREAVVGAPVAPGPPEHAATMTATTIRPAIRIQATSSEPRQYDRPRPHRRPRDFSARW